MQPMTLSFVHGFVLNVEYILFLKLGTEIVFNKLSYMYVNCYALNLSEKTVRLIKGNHEIIYQDYP